MTDYERDALVFAEVRNYNGYHANISASYFDPRGKDILVVGCGRGGDCRYFVEMGANFVTGLDILEDIGRDFENPRVRYERASAENMPFPDASFDIIYCFATMEHVPNIKAAYCEMARVGRIGAGIYCIAAPLWNTRQGPHWADDFNDIPWAHLRFSLKEVIADSRSKKKRITADQIEYLLSSSEMNKRPARDYLAACWMIKNIDVIKNEVEIQSDRDSVPQDIVSELRNRGYSDLELFGMTHYFVARVLA